MNEQQINEFIRIMNTVDGRDFFYNFALSVCGVDFAEGICSSPKTDYQQGVEKCAIDLFNLMLYHCPDKMFLMLDEQKRRLKNG